MSSPPRALHLRIASAAAESVHPPGSRQPTSPAASAFSFSLLKQGGKEEKVARKQGKDDWVTRSRDAKIAKAMAIKPEGPVRGTTKINEAEARQKLTQGIEAP